MKMLIFTVDSILIGTISTSIAMVKSGNQNYYLHCYSLHPVRWYVQKNGNIRPEVRKDNHGYSLRIRLALPSDTGRYICEGLDTLRKEFRAFSDLYVGGTYYS